MCDKFSRDNDKAQSANGSQSVINQSSKVTAPTRLPSVSLFIHWGVTSVPCPDTQGRAQRYKG